MKTGIVVIELLEFWLYGQIKSKDQNNKTYILKQKWKNRLGSVKYIQVPFCYFLVAAFNAK